MEDIKEKSADEEKEVIEFLKKSVKEFDDVFSDKTFSQSIERQRTILNLIETQNRMIDSMTEIIANVTVPKEECKQCIIEYFRNKAKESE